MSSRSRSRSRSSSGSPQRRRSPIRGTSRERMHSRCLFVGNLPYSFKERDLEDLFERCGAVKNVTVGMNKQTGQSKCYAFVEFEDRRDAADALAKYNGYDIEGRRLRIDWDIGLQTKMQYYGTRRRTDNRRPSQRSRSLQVLGHVHQEEAPPGLVRGPEASPGHTTDITRATSITLEVTEIGPTMPPGGH
ncbi:RNA-binding motif protein, X-linked 2 [Pelomyxa schiedti]|nr:RNA-binding motif protein, X-linked 2 [Pelomyxa schiedti]